jgi:dTDP-glucose 4,6-dehydratase
MTIETKYLKHDLDEVVSLAYTDLKTLEGSRLLITGGTGFVGKWLLYSLLNFYLQTQIKFEVIVISRNPKKFIEENPSLNNELFRYIRSSIEDVQAAQKQIGSFDYLIHAATEAGINPVDINLKDVLNTVVDGTYAIHELAGTSGCKRSLNISSGAVYGPQPSDMERIQENYLGGPNPLDVHTSYHHTKRLAEFIAVDRAKLHSYDVVTARLFAFIGPYLPIDSYFAAGNFIRDAITRKPITINGDGKPIRSYQYPVDLVIWLIGMLARGAIGEAYNVGSSRGTSLSDLAERITNLSDNSEAVVVLGKSSTNLAGLRYVPDISKAELQLQLKNSVSLDDAIIRTIKWHRSVGVSL